MSTHFYERMGFAVKLSQRWPMLGVLAPENHEVVIYYSTSKLPVLEEQTAQPTPHAPTMYLVGTYGGSYY